MEMDGQTASIANAKAAPNIDKVFFNFFLLR
jgi:hypothetical protein